MELEIFRMYHENGTNGKLYVNNSFQCYTIELPWLHNEPQYSCVPEGRYELKKRCSEKFKEHLLVSGVPKRELILVHPANDALKELRGCIAPVSILSAPGKGVLSRIAFEKLLKVVYEALKTESVYLTISILKNECNRKNGVAYARLL